MEQTLTKDRIVEVATRLFAGLGYDMTSLELIADAVGAPRSSVEELTGGKRELYLTVMEQIFEAKRAKIQAVVDGTGSEYEAAHRIADVYLDFYARNPQLLALWRHLLRPRDRFAQIQRTQFHLQCTKGQKRRSKARPGTSVWRSTGQTT